MNPVEQFLRDNTKMMRRHKISVGGYWGLSDFVAQHGHEFNLDNPLEIRLGEPRHCYMNAARLALSHRGYTYCEGYAAGVIPVMHAWVIKDGRIGETTWPELGSAYYGIAFKTEYLRKELLTSKRYGLIDRWWDDWPLITQPKDQWYEHHPVERNDKDNRQAAV